MTLEPSDHGDLIDRDKLLDKIHRLWSEYSKNGWEYVGKDDVLKAIWDTDVEVEVIEDDD